MWSKGFAAEETKAAFARVAQFAGQTESDPARFATYDAGMANDCLCEESMPERKKQEIFSCGKMSSSDESRKLAGLSACSAFFVYYWAT